MKTLLIGEIHEDAHNLLKENVDFSQISTEEFLQQSSLDHEAIVLRTYTPLQKEQLSKLPRLKKVVSCSVGINNIDLDELKKREIELIHCPGTNSNAVAEHTIHLILDLCRHKTPFIELTGKTIGIIGFGYIGKLVAKKLKGFGANIIAYDIIEQDTKVLEELNVTMKPLSEILPNADIITIHVPLFPQTKGMINEEVFSQMKDGCLFINTSREEIIDDESLLKHFPRFEGAALDVYSEKIKKEFSGKSNIILTPHIAAKGKESWKRMCVEPVEKFIKDI
ncbi:MAG: NAD(P)-dependent oxidoreductase [archaeon]|nr:NAD(P)-dependent oxidoreductase [archaeon]